MFEGLEANATQLSPHTRSRVPIPTGHRRDSDDDSNVCRMHLRMSLPPKDIFHRCWHDGARGRPSGFEQLGYATSLVPIVFELLSHLATRQIARPATEKRTSSTHTSYLFCWPASALVRPCCQRSVTSFWADLLPAPPGPNLGGMFAKASSLQSNA